MDSGGGREDAARSFQEAYVGFCEGRETNGAGFLGRTKIDGKEGGATWLAGVLDLVYRNNKEKW